MSRLVIVPMDKRTKIYATMDTSSFLDEDLSWREKGILAYLLSRPPGWKINMKDLQHRSKDGRDAVYKSINSLRLKKYIHRSSVYKNGKIQEWIFIVFPRPMCISKKDLEALLPEFQEQGALLPENLHQAFQEVLVYKNIYTPDLENPENEKSSTPTKKKVRPSIKSRNKEFLIYAKKLAEIIKSTKNIKTSTQRLNSWAGDFRKLHETDGVEKVRIKQGIIWYRHNAGGQYIPVLESGASFRSKFIKLENAMERAGELNQQDPSIPKRKGIRVGHK